MLTTKVRKNHNSLITTIPSSIAKMLDLKRDESVQWEISGRKIVITPVKKQEKQ